MSKLETKNSMVEMFPVASSRIIEMGYDPESATVYVRFPNLKAWQYKNVPSDVWDEFVQAESKGQYIKRVLDHYENGPADI